MLNMAVCCCHDVTQQLRLLNNNVECVHVQAMLTGADAVGESKRGQEK